MVYQIEREQKLEEILWNFAKNVSEISSQTGTHKYVAAIEELFCPVEIEHPKPLPMPERRKYTCEICGFTSTDWQDFNVDHIGGHGALVPVCKDTDSCMDRKDARNRTLSNIA